MFYFERKVNIVGCHLFCDMVTIGEAIACDGVVCDERVAFSGRKNST